MKDKYKIGHDFSNRVPEDEEIIANIGGYCFTQTEEDIKIYGRLVTSSKQFRSTNLVYTSITKDNLDFMEDEWEISPHRMYHKISIPCIDKNNEEYGAAFIFDNLNDALSFLGTLAQYLTYQHALSTIKKEVKNDKE